MTHSSPSSADMQKAVELLADKVNRETDSLLAYIRSLEADHRAMREALGKISRKHIALRTGRNSHDVQLDMQEAARLAVSSLQIHE